MSKMAAFHRRLVLDGPCSLWDWMVYILLVPIGLLYGIVGWGRALLYRVGIIGSYRASVPVISVGNLAVGGTGKTPVVDYLASGLLTAGFRVAIVSRGYGGNTTKPVTLVSSGDGPLVSAEECGDEPYLLARRNPLALIAVGSRRKQVVRYVVDDLDADVVLLDDGYQHLAVARDLNFLLLDAKHPFGNRQPLPAGLLREFPSAIKRADALIFTRYHQHDVSQTDVGKPVYRCRHAFSETLMTLDGESISLSDVCGRRVVAFAGIADPESFFDQLRARGVDLIESIALPDHVKYDYKLQDRLVLAAQKADFLVTTEKDAVKLQGLSFSVPCCQARLVLNFLEESKPLQQVLSLLKERAHDHK